MTGLQPAGFPHSEICGSKVACTSPQLIAACRVLPRLFAPRHPPCALTTLGQSPWTAFKRTPSVPPPHLIRTCFTPSFFGARFSSNSPDKQRITSESLFAMPGQLPRGLPARALQKALDLTKPKLSKIAFCSRGYYFVRPEPLKITKSASRSTPFRRPVDHSKQPAKDRGQEVPLPGH